MFKEEFPIFQNKEIVYLDTAASSQKPECVLKSMDYFYRNSYANVHRGQCEIATQATSAYERSREEVASFLKTNPKNIIFTKGTTEAINLVASSYEKQLSKGDEVLVSIAEHHANFVPWQQICKRTGAHFKVFNVLENGMFDWNDYLSKLTSKTKIVAVAQMSNVLGIKNPIEEIINEAHKKGARVLVDGAQGIAHISTDVAKLECDYYVFSGHKIYGPTGIGVLYGNTEALSELSPYQYGGDMIKTVTPKETLFADIPARFEAGTTPFVEAVGLAEALRFIKSIGIEKIEAHEQELTKLFLKELSQIKNIELMGSSLAKQGIISLNVKNIHPTDIAFVLAKENVCVRVGHHCAMPIHQRFQKEASLRVSFGLYNEKTDVERFLNSLNKALRLLGEN